MTRNKQSLLSLEKLKSVLRYSPENGEFMWIVDMSVPIKKGMIAGSITPGGYRKIGIFGFHYFAHRLAWLYMTGDWPASEIDHKDNNKLNNSWGNLRLADPSTNQANISKRSTNSSGYKGVTWQPSCQKWQAQIKFRGAVIYLGIFNNPSDAHEVYRQKAIELFGDFARM